MPEDDARYPCLGNEQTIISQDVDDLCDDMIRERNRIHARRTRLKRKLVMDGLESKLLSLQREVGEFHINVLPDDNSMVLDCHFGKTTGRIQHS